MSKQSVKQNLNLSHRTKALGLGSWIFNLRLQVLGPESQVLGPRICVLSPGSYIPGPGPRDTCPESWVRIHSVVITKCDIRLLQVWHLLQNASGYKVVITKLLLQQLLQSVTGITACDNHYKVRRNKALAHPNCIFFRSILTIFYFYLQERMEYKSCFDTPY